MIKLEILEGANATYSPEDNKLRLRTPERLETDLYDFVRKAGFRYAPKQELFVAPMWTPYREDVLIKLCGTVGDEDTSLIERAEQRAERFEVYSDKRAEDAERAKETADSLGDVVNGQPLLIGHHSEKKARKAKEKIENNLNYAVKMWETSEYWTDRAAGAIHAAKYKELPSVRARRIKKLEKEKRKEEKVLKHSKTVLKMWADIKGCAKEKDVTEKDVALFITGRYCDIYYSFTLEEYPRQEEASQYEGSQSLYSALQDGIATVEQVKELSCKGHERTVKGYERWTKHTENRIIYEKAMLQESGGLATDRTKPEKGGACRNRFSKDGEWSFIQKVNKITLTTLEKHYYEEERFFRVNTPFDKLNAVMTKAEVEEARLTGKLYNETKDGFYLQAEETTKKTEPKILEETEAEKNLKNVKETLEKGVEVVVANQLFPTPKNVVEKMMEFAGIESDDDVLEPSAGTGAIVGAMENGNITAVEINPQLVTKLKEDFPLVEVTQGDFLDYDEPKGFDVVIMNPPFEKGSDIKHIKHALTLLREDGGRLVAICANGPRQQKELMPLATHWEDLPVGTFKNAGTMVNTSLLVIDN